MDTSLLDKAIHFAVDAHQGAERRGKGFPYILHPMEAAAIVATMTADQRLLAAAVLHDVVEDTDTTIEQIRRAFGDDIAQLVAKESHPKGLGWRESRKHILDHLRVASRESQIVALGDKLSNMRAIARDYEQQGDDLWKIFHAKDRSDHEWHYRGLAASLSELEGTFAYREFVDLIDGVYGKQQ